MTSSWTHSILTLQFSKQASKGVKTIASKKASNQPTTNQPTETLLHYSICSIPAIKEGSKQPPTSQPETQESNQPTTNQPTNQKYFYHSLLFHCNILPASKKQASKQPPNHNQSQTLPPFPSSNHGEPTLVCKLKNKCLIFFKTNCFPLCHSLPSSFAGTV